MGPVITIELPALLDGLTPEQFKELSGLALKHVLETGLDMKHDNWLKGQREASDA